MKLIHRSAFLFLLVFLLVCMTAFGTFAEGDLVLPSSTLVVEKEAFYGTKGIDRAVLPEGVLEIKERAFAESSLKTINLPASITSIADNAFDGSPLNTVIAKEGTYSYNWAVSHHYIDEDPVTGRLFYFAGKNNDNHFFERGGTADLSARITSTAAIQKITASVFYLDGPQEGLKWCDDISVLCAEDTYSFETYGTDLEYGIACEALPCGMFRLCLYAELADERVITACEYDFEVIERCSSVILPSDEIWLPFGETTLLSPAAEPSTASYADRFHYFSSDPDIVYVDSDGILYARDTLGSAVISVYSGDWYAAASCEVNVYNPLDYEECPVEIEVWSNAGSGNTGKYHQYGTSAEFTGMITSSVAIYEVYSSVVYRGGDLDGQSAYDCSQAVYYGGEDTYSIRIGSSALNTRLKFGNMPCAPLRMCLYAELIDGRTYKIYEYDFEIIKKCTSISLNRYEKRLPYGATFQITACAEPWDATYPNTFHYRSNSPYNAAVDENGLVQCTDNPGTAIITVYSEDWAVCATCEITVAGDVLEGEPQIVNALDESAIYDSPFGRSIWLNFTGVDGAYLYDVYRATSETGPFEFIGATEGDNETEWWIGPYDSGCTAVDNECDEDVIYYYKIQARSSSGALSDFSNMMVAHTGVNMIEEQVWIDSTIDELADYVDGSYETYYGVNGVIASNYEISRVTVTITNEWKTTMLSTDEYPWDKVYDLSNLDLYTYSFPDGYYKLVITATADDETKTIVRKWFAVYNSRYQPSTEQMQQDVLNYVINRKTSIFLPGPEVGAYLANMSTVDIIAMGLSDYTDIATSWIKDVIWGTPYNSYMELKYEKQIIDLLNDVFPEGKTDSLEALDSVAKVVKDLNSFVKKTTDFSLKEFGNELKRRINELDSVRDWQILGTLNLVHDCCDMLSDAFDYVGYTEDFVNILCELFTDHSKDLAALDLIAEVYNPYGDPEFTAALNTIRNNYRTQYGRSVQMIFDKLEKELTKKATKEINKIIMTEVVGSAYSLADTIAQITFKLTGITAAGKIRIEFVTQNNILHSMNRAYENICNEILESYYTYHTMPSENQINQLQAAFRTARQALIALNETMEELDEANIGAYLYYIDEAEKMTMPGVGRV